MATKFYNVAKAAEVLGVSPDEINAMRERQELHGYRDGADWKFKADEIDALVGKLDAPPAGDADVLLSEVELGESDPGASGTIIGPPPEEALAKPAGPADSSISGISGFEDLHLSLGDSQLDLEIASATSGMSGLELAGDEVDDDDLVLGGSGSGSGSDITIGGDSGISLIDPTDSGLSLEEPLDLAAGSSESLELGEDDMFSLAENSAILSPSDLGAGGGDFTLTPMDDGSADDESGSQVIALDVEPDSGIISAAPMLDGDLAGELEAIGPAPLTPVASVARMNIAEDYASPAGGRQVVAAGTGALPDTPYSGWNVFFLSMCAILLLLIGMMMYDLTRNMWSWNETVQVNSWLMDTILGRK